MDDAELIREAIHMGDMARSWPDVVLTGRQMAMECWKGRGEPESCEERCFANWLPVGCRGKQKRLRLAKD